MMNFSMEVMSQECLMEDSLMVALKLCLYEVEVLEHLESGTYCLIPINFVNFTHFVHNYFAEYHKVAAHQSAY